MGGHLKRRIAGIAITGVLIAGVVGVTSMSASGQSQEPAFIPYGTLTIQLSSSGGTYVLDRPGTADDVTELISTVQPCATVAPNSGQLVRIAPTTPADTVQIRNNAFGVNTNNTSCGSSQAAVISGSERLKIELGPTLTGAGVLAKSADVQVTRRSSGDLNYELDAGTPGAQTGPLTTITQSPQTVAVDPTELFRSITFASTSKKSNEGLSIATGTTFELFVPFGDAVDCGDQVTEIGDDGDIADSATFFRGENGTKTTGDCVDVGVIVDIVANQWVFWDNSNLGIDGSPQAVNGTVTIVWAPVEVAGAAQLEREIDYDGPGPGVFTPTLWCTSFSSTTDLAGDVTFDVTLPNYIGPGSILVDGVEKAPWCLVSDERVLNADADSILDDGKITQTQVLFGSGDPRMR